MEWRDATSYSHKGTGRGHGECEPQTWELFVGDNDDRRTRGGIRIVVTRLHGVTDRWYLLCHALGITSHRDLDEPDVANAQRKAVGVVNSLLLRKIADFQSSAAALTEWQK